MSKRPASFNDAFDFGLLTIDRFALRAGWDDEYVREQKFKLLMEALRHFRRIRNDRKTLIHVSHQT